MNMKKIRIGEAYAMIAYVFFNTLGKSFGGNFVKKANLRGVMFPFEHFL